MRLTRRNQPSHKTLSKALISVLYTDDTFRHEQALGRSRPSNTKLLRFFLQHYEELFFYYTTYLFNYGTFVMSTNETIDLKALISVWDKTWRSGLMVERSTTAGSNDFSRRSRSLHAHNTYAVAERPFLLSMSLTFLEKCLVRTIVLGIPSVTCDTEVQSKNVSIRPTILGISMEGFLSFLRDDQLIN